MRILLSLISVVLIVIITEALVCQKCENYQGLLCDNYTVETCLPRVKNCFVNILMKKIGNNIRFQSSRGCATFIGPCFNNFSMTVGSEDWVDGKAHCCNTDNCNKNLIIMVRTDTLENALQCPACIRKGSTCTPKSTPCHGAQDHCFEFSGDVSNGTAFEHWTLKGCTTGNVCESCTRHYKKPFPLRADYKLDCSFLNNNY